MFTLLNLNDAVAAAATPSNNDRRRTQSASSSSSSSSSSSTLTDVATASKQKRRPADKEEHVVDADNDSKHQSVPIFEEFDKKEYMPARKDPGQPARPPAIDDKDDECETDTEIVDREEEEDESESDNLEVLKKLLQRLEKQEKKKTGKNGEASVGGKEKKSTKESVNNGLPSTSAHGGKKEKNSRPEASNGAVRKSSPASSGFRPHSLGLSLASRAVASRAKKTPVGRSVAGLIKTYAAFAGHIAGIQQYLEDLDNATANKEN